MDFQILFAALVGQEDNPVLMYYCNWIRKKKMYIKIKDIINVFESMMLVIF